MTLTSRYMSGVRNVPAIMDAIVRGTAPTKFTQQHLKDIGFSSSNDRAIIGVLKDLDFLSDDGTPTARYHAYRNPTESRRIMGEAVREAYGDLLTINAEPTDRDRAAIQGKFKSTHNVSDRVSEEQARTFFAFLNLADLAASNAPSSDVGAVDSADPDGEPISAGEANGSNAPTARANGIQLGYTIQVHLPATTDINVYNAVFKSLKEHLLD